MSLPSGNLPYCTEGLTSSAKLTLKKETFDLRLSGVYLEDGSESTFAELVGRVEILGSGD